MADEAWSLMGLKQERIMLLDDELRATQAERQRAQEACERMGKRIAKLEAALLRMTAIIETQIEPDIDALHDVAREALNTK